MRLFAPGHGTDQGGVDQAHATARQPSRERQCSKRCTERSRSVGRQRYPQPPKHDTAPIAAAQHRKKEEMCQGDAGRFLGNDQSGITGGKSELVNVRAQEDGTDGSAGQARQPQESHDPQKLPRLVRGRPRSLHTGRYADCGCHPAVATVLCMASFSSWISVKPNSARILEVSIAMS